MKLKCIEVNMFEWLDKLHIQWTQYYTIQHLA